MYEVFRKKCPKCSSVHVEIIFENTGQFFLVKVRIIALLPFKSFFSNFFPSIRLKMMGFQELVVFFALNSAIKHTNVSIFPWLSIIVSLMAHRCLIDESLMFSGRNIAGFCVEKH